MQKIAKSHTFRGSVCSTAAHFACSLNDVAVNDIGNCYKQLIVYKALLLISHAKAVFL